MEKLNPYQHSNSSNSLLEGDYVTSNRNLIDSNRASNAEVESLIKQCSNLIEPRWEKRHAKAIYLIGVARYKELYLLAEKYGRNPKAYLAHLVNEALVLPSLEKSED
jgi:tRNA(Ile)-lysidine synthase TilS/MesJ